jgi:hypothetical protein
VKNQEFELEEKRERTNGKKKKTKGRRKSSKYSLKFLLNS